MKHLFAVFCDRSIADRVKNVLHDSQVESWDDSAYADAFKSLFEKQLLLHARLDPFELNKDVPEDSITIDSDDGKSDAWVAELHPDTSEYLGKMIAGYIGFQNDCCWDDTLHFLVSIE